MNQFLNGTVPTLQKDQILASKLWIWWPSNKWTQKFKLGGFKTYNGKITKIEHLLSFEDHQDPELEPLLLV